MDLRNLNSQLNAKFLKSSLGIRIRRKDGLHFYRFKVEVLYTNCGSRYVVRKTFGLAEFVF